MQQNVKFNDKLSPEKELAVCRAMMELSGDIAFEWDVDSDVISLSDKWEARFATPSLRRDFGPYIESGTSVIHQEDLASMISEINSMRNGAAYGESVVRIIDKNGSYTWNRVRAASECDESGRLVRIIGTIADIDSDKRRSQALLVKAEQDSLTGLLNKDTARFRAEQYLANMGENQRAAMLVIDLDNFKAVNDQYGHLFGDTVLSHVGSTIRSLFRDSDIMARIGGDEFMVLMRDIPDSSLVEHRCIRLTQAMKQLYGRQLQQCQFSCSVGVAMVPEHGNTYQKLFQRADKALYQAKDLGKNTYAIFSHDAETKRYEAKVKPRLQMDSGLVSAWGDAALYMLEQLYESQDVSAALKSVMEMIGVQLQTEHIFLIDLEQNKAAMEWMHPHISPEGAGFTKNSVYPWDKALGLFNEEGLFYCHDTSLAPEARRSALAIFDAKAVLLCAVQRRGRTLGYVGMRSVFESKLWTQKEIDALSFIARMASMFLWGSKQEYRN